MQKNSSPKSFKQSVERIEEIVTIMEEGECELENMIILYEEANTLISTCSSKLEQAKLKISQINKEGEEKN